MEEFDEPLLEVMGGTPNTGQYGGAREKIAEGQ